MFDDAPLSVAPYGSHEGIEHVLIAKRLGKIRRDREAVFGISDWRGDVFLLELGIPIYV